MGTPDFAVPSLEILVNAGYDIVGVITAPDRKGGRGRKKLIESPIKLFAKEKGLHILQPTNLKNKTFLEDLKSLKADLQIVVAFRMLPVAVWDMPPKGTYNLHGSLLPKYRGAAPINWSIIKGDIKTGVTSFKLKHEIDTGSILLQKEIPIYPSDNATALHDRMMYEGADTVYETVKMIEENSISLQEQRNEEVSHAPKLNKENTKLDFSQNADEVHNMVRGLSLYPVAWFNLEEKMLKVYASSVEENTSNEKSGTIISDNKSFIKVACQEGCLVLNDIQITGKKRMSVKDFLNGFDLSPFAKIVTNV